MIASLADGSLEMILATGDAIPIVSSITKGIKSATAIKDYFFYEKVVDFMKTIGQVPTERRVKMIAQIQSDSRYREKFGKTTLIILDRLDDKQKATLLGRLAVHLANEEMNYEVYRRLAYIVDRMYINDILDFANKNDTFADYRITNLESLGVGQQ